MSTIPRWPSSSCARTLAETEDRPPWGIATTARAPHSWKRWPKPASATCSPTSAATIPGLIEALAQARAEGRRADLPELIVCPHETVALSAAHAYAAVSGEPQAVLVHVDAGTQNLGGAVHNAARGRIPVLIFAGAAPVHHGR